LTWPAQFSEWRNVNSFIARLTSHGFDGLVYLGIMELTAVLEEPAKRGPVMDCWAWAAAEWVISSSDVLRQYITNPEKKAGPNDPAAPETGELCKDIDAQSMERWNFWKAKFGEILASESLSDETVEHVKKALEVMKTKS
jgi:hypothetical protein